METTIMAQDSKFTDIELNNIVYIGLKYACGIETPSNKMIYMLMLMVWENRTIDNIIEVVVQHARSLTVENNIDYNTSFKKRKFMALIKEFCGYPYSIRNSLGKDDDYSKSITKN